MRRPARALPNTFSLAPRGAFFDKLALRAAWFGFLRQVRPLGLLGLRFADKLALWGCLV